MDEIKAGQFEAAAMQAAQACQESPEAGFDFWLKFIAHAERKNPESSPGFLVNKLNDALWVSRR